VAFEKVLDSTPISYCIERIAASPLTRLVASVDPEAKIPLTMVPVGSAGIAAEMS
jgi:hypothetical protein